MDFATRLVHYKRTEVRWVAASIPKLTLSKTKREDLPRHNL